MRALKLTFGIIATLLFISTGSAFAQYSGTGSNSDVEYVEGYTKDNGTYVEGYYRTEANDYNLDNFSAEGNYNPYTGDVGTIEYDSPYNSYNSNSSSSYNSSSSFYDTNYDSGVSIDTDYGSSYESSYDYDYNYDSIYN